MKRMIIEDGTVLVLGTAREIQNTLRGMTQERGFYPAYLDPPRFNPYKMYGVEIDNDGTWQIISSDTVVRYLISGIL